MSGKVKRKIFRVGRSHVMTLPPEWVKDLNSKNVMVLFDHYVLVVKYKKSVKTK
jgi:hypothetical protein